jgi:hypothetical protein
MTLATIATLIIGVVSAATGIACFYLAWRFHSFEHSALKRGKERYRSLRDVFAGRAIVHHDFAPDIVVQAGMSYNYDKKRVVPNGRLSDEVVTEFLGG